MTVEALLTTDDVARLLGVDVKTVRGEVRAGRLARILIGKRSVRFHPGDVGAYIERMKVCSTSAEGSGTINSISTGSVIAGPQGKRRKPPRGKSKIASETVQGPWIAELKRRQH
jgi:excisionase family DNA binding protein